MLKMIMIIFTLVELILPSYANVVGPDGIDSCQRIQMEIDDGAKRDYLVSTLIENMNNSIDGNLEIIDSDCFYHVVITDHYDGMWTATIPPDGSEEKKFDFIIEHGKITNDEFGIKGLSYNSDLLVLEFSKIHENVCYGYAEFVPTLDGTILKGNVDCSDGISRVISAEIGEFSSNEGSLKHELEKNTDKHDEGLGSFVLVATIILIIILTAVIIIKKRR